MFKKIALAAALTASASFATWDYFPILDGGKGQAELDVAYFKIEKLSELQIAAAARYSITPNFELGIGIPFLLYAAYDGESYDDVAGLGKIQLMTRYQFTPNVSAFVDFILPTCGDNTCDDDGAFAFHFGAQYSQKFGIVNFGSELGLQLETAGDNDVTPPWELNIGVEADFEVNPVFVPYVGLETTPCSASTLTRVMTQARATLVKQALTRTSALLQTSPRKSMQVHSSDSALAKTTTARIRSRQSLPRSASTSKKVSA